MSENDRPTRPSGDRTLNLCFVRGIPARPVQIIIPTEGVLLGRDGGAFDVPSCDPRLSARHAWVSLDGAGHATVRDLGSTGGTWVNGERITGERTLEHGDVLRLADTLFLYSRGLRSDNPSEGGLVGTSAVMAAVRRSVSAVAPRKHAVVVTGETGTGKEVVAKLIHEQSGRSGPFIAVNCSAFTDALLTSELFGHVKGAFTGAVTEHTGLFRAARGGTLLLDELADIPPHVQACLLRVLETRSVRPVGATRDVEVDVRVIATSNRELAELVQSGAFRADLYARLAQWTIRTPRLCERREDIPELVAHLLPRVDGHGRSLSSALCEKLLLHGWPLNVRGLMNVLSIAVVSSMDDARPLDLTDEVQDALWATRNMARVDGTMRYKQISAAAQLESAEPAWSPPQFLDKEELERLMTQFQGHVAAAARHIGMTRPKLYRMLGAHSLAPEEFRRPRGSGSC